MGFQTSSYEGLTFQAPIWRSGTQRNRNSFRESGVSNIELRMLNIPIPRMLRNFNIARCRKAAKQFGGSVHRFIGVARRGRSRTCTCIPPAPPVSGAAARPPVPEKKVENPHPRKERGSGATSKTRTPKGKGIGCRQQRVRHGLDLDRRPRQDDV